MKTILQNILESYNLPQHENGQRIKYTITQTKSNRGDKFGLPHYCNWEKDEDMNSQFIPVGEPLIRLTEMKTIEYDYGKDSGTRPVFKSWLFHNEECLVQWLDKYNPNERL